MNIKEQSLDKDHEILEVDAIPVQPEESSIEDAVERARSSSNQDPENYNFKDRIVIAPTLDVNNGTTQSSIPENFLEQEATPVEVYQQMTEIEERTFQHG
jgi:hypothetical protein